MEDMLLTGVTPRKGDSEICSEGPAKEELGGANRLLASEALEPIELVEKSSWRCLSVTWNEIR